MELGVGRNFQPESIFQPAKIGRTNFNMSSRQRCGKISFFALTALLAAGSLPAAEPLTPEEERELAALAQFPNWTMNASLSGAAGYRENVLLSSTNPVGSGFARGEVEAMLLRLPTGGLDGYLFLNAIETRYFSTTKTDHERTAFLVGEVRWQPVDSLKGSLQAQGYHQDQVFDVSTTETSLDTALLKMTGFTLTPALRWNFTPQWWLEAKAVARRDSFDRDLDGYDDGEARFRVGRTWGHGSEWSLEASRRWRAHDSREQFSAGGRPLTGTLLKARLTEFGTQLSWVVDAERHWRFTGALAREENRDNGSGYFDYDRDVIAAGLTWDCDPWEIQLGIGHSDYDFPVQLVGFGIAPEHRRKKETLATIEVTRHLTASLALFAFFEAERSTSNDARSQFQNNTGYAGIRWSWDQLSKVLEE